MKKFLSLFTALLFFGSMMFVQADITIKAKVPSGWANPISVYLFGTDADGFHAATQEGEWWSYTYTGANSSINAIFVNGGDWNGDSNQTVDIVDISSDACYELTTNGEGKCSATEVDCPILTTITIKGKVPAEWTNDIYVYLFSTDADGFHAATQEGEWWSYTYTGANSSINAIFVNGGDWNGDSNQTVDIVNLSSDACYQVSYNSTEKCTVSTVDCPSTPDPEPVQTTITIKGKVPAEWTNDIHVYLFETDDNGFHAATQEGEWWSYTYTGSSSSINAIFVNGGDWIGDSNQTVDIVNLSSDACYEISTNGTAKCMVSTVDCPSTPDPEPVQTTITIKGKVPSEWDNNIYVYLFETDNDGFHAATQEGEWWSYTYTGSSSSINAIFVNGNGWNGDSNQTVDIVQLSSDACYQVSYNSTGKCSAVPVDCPSVPEPPVGPAVVRMSGDFITPGTWLDTDNFAGDEDAVSLKMNLVEGNYEFGLIVNNVMIVNGTAFTRENTSAQITNGNENLTLDADVDGEYTFTWTYATNTLSIEYPAAIPVEYATIKFFAPRDQSNMWNNVYAYATKGNKQDFGPKPGQEITTKEAEWYVVTVRKGSNLQFSDNAGMETEVITDIQEDACYISAAINYNVFPRVVTLEKKCTVDYYVAGDAAIMGEWNAANAACKFDENNQVVFHDVPAGSYQFKITNGSWAWSIGGNEFLSDEPGCGTIATEKDLGNTAFTIDELQDVTITYYPATRKICLGAITVKTVGELSAYDMNIYVNEWRSPNYQTNIEGYTNDDITLSLVSGDACVEFDGYQFKGIAEGSAVVKMTIAETALFTSAEAEFTVTVSNVPVPPTPSENWVEVRSGLSAGNYYTICYPKKMTAIKGGSLWSFATKDANMVQIMEANAPYEAGMPYIIYAESDKLEAILEIVDNPQAGNFNGLYGTLEYMSNNNLVSAGATYMLKNNEIRPIGEGYLNAERAYIKLDEIPGGEPANIPGRRVRAIPMQTETATGIGEVQGDEVQCTKVLIDGQIFILRGEKMYDVTGKLVK